MPSSGFHGDCTIHMWYTDICADRASTHKIKNKSNKKDCHNATVPGHIMSQDCGLCLCGSKTQRQVSVFTAHDLNHFLATA